MRLGMTDDDQIGVKRVEDSLRRGFSPADRTKFSVDVEPNAKGPKVLTYQCRRGFGIGIEPLGIGDHRMDCLLPHGEIR